MFMKNKKIFLIGLLATIISCSSNVNLSKYYKSYNFNFNSNTPYIKHSVKRDSKWISVREFGWKFKNKKHTIVLMHGFPDSQHLYDRVIPYLSKKAHVISFDFLGWGDSENSVNMEYTSDSLRKDFEAVYDSLNLDLVTLVVHDASGPPGIDWALDNPSKIKSLVLLNTYYVETKTLRAPEAIDLFSTPSFKNSMISWFARQSDSQFRSGVKDQLLKFMADKPYREKYINVFQFQAPRMRDAFLTLNKNLRAEVLARKKQVTKLGKFTKKVLIIFGAKDIYLNVGVAKWFQKIFQNSNLHLIDNAFHYVQIDAPKKVSKIILSSF